jgi:hypothetical protein
MKNSYRCPTCARTILNMESQFRALDVEIEMQPLPAPYSDWRCLIGCNDCSAKSNVQFHFLGLKCDNCASYNTSQVKIIRPEVDSGVVDGASSSSSPQPISPGRLERMIRPAVPMLSSPPRAASTEHGNAVEAQILSNANRAIAAADVAIQAASGLGVDREVPVPVPIIDDGWETENSDDFLDDDDEEEEEEVYAHELSEEEEEDDDDDEEELINLRGHI